MVSLPWASKPAAVLANWVARKCAFGNLAAANRSSPLSVSSRSLSPVVERADLDCDLEAAAREVAGAKSKLTGSG